MRVFFTALLCTLILFTPFACAADGTSLEISARACVLVDRASGRVLFRQNADELMPIASTTKIMTAMLALERADLDETVTTSKNASGVEGTSLYLSEGETLSMHQMLLGLMLRSGNDAAVAIAEHIGGSVEEFVRLMNGRAKAINATAFFTNPNGLDEGGNGASALGLAKIACEALDIPEFRSIVSTQTATLPWPGSQYKRALSNKNKLLKTYEGATGVKTGFTSKAGRCLVFSAWREDMELVGVVLNCGTWFETGETLLDWGFDAYHQAQLLAAGEIAAEIPVSDGVLGSVSVTTKENFKVPVTDTERMELRIDVPDKLAAPILSGQTIGTAHAVIDGVSVASKTLYAAEAVEKRDYTSMLQRLLRYWRLWP